MIHSVKELDVWSNAMNAAMEVFAASKTFPTEERYSLTDQIRRSSRSVASQLAEAWRKRRHVAAFRAKLNDAEGEAAETQTWIELARRSRYWNDDTAARLDRQYEIIPGQLVRMIDSAEKWCAGLVRPAP